MRSKKVHDHAVKNLQKPIFLPIAARGRGLVDTHTYKNSGVLCQNRIKSLKEIPGCKYTENVLVDLIQTSVHAKSHTQIIISV